MEAELLYLTCVIALGVAAQWLAWRLRLPAILLLLLFGFAAGQAPVILDHLQVGEALQTESDISLPDQIIGRDLLAAVVSLSVAVILFEGGLSLRIRELRETGRDVFRLVTVGVLVTWLLTAAAAWLVLDFHPRMAVVVGALLVVSGPTVIVPLLRHVRPSRQIGSVVRWEGIVNDPIGAALAVLVFESVVAGRVRELPLSTLVGLLATAGLGCLIGGAVAAALVLFLKRHWIPDFLHNAVFLAIVLVTYSASNMVISESGLFTVTLLGVILANQRVVTVKHVIEFKENLRVLLISSLFIVLTSRLRPQDVAALGTGGIAFLTALIFVVRPAAVWLATYRSGLSTSERWFLAWMAPRGIVAAAVASIFALEMSTAPAGSVDAALAEDARRLVPVAFLVIVGTVTVYGLSAAPLARRLGIAEPNRQGVLFAGASAWARSLAAALHEQGYNVLLVDTNRDQIATARMEGLPTYCASALSETVREDIDMGGIGRLLAVTPNDDVNTLATLEFSDEFGMAEVYRLAPREIEGTRQEPVPPHLRGRVLFGETITFEELQRRGAAGDVVKKTKLTGEFDYEAFRAMYGEDAIVLMIIEESGTLKVCTADTTAAPSPGQTLISLVRPTEPPTANADERSAS